MSFDKSRRLASQAKELFPGGINSNNYYVPALDGPVFIDHADGAYLFDVDGNRYIDFWPSHSSLLLGHNHPAVRKATEEQLRRGSNFGLFSSVQLDLAKELKQRFPMMERLVFTDSNTRGTSYAMRLARASTGRQLIAKFQGGYHGTIDTVFIGLQKVYDEPLGDKVVRPGVTSSLANDVVLFQWNDVAQCEAQFAKFGSKIAGLIVEPVMGDGVILPQKGFLEFLRDACRKCGALLVYDEAVTCSMSAGGAQEVYGVVPDITVIGKSMGGGLPIAAVGASQKIMDLTDPNEGMPAVPVSMTYAGHPVACAAGLAQLKLLGPKEYDYMSGLAETLAEGTARIAKAHKAPLSINVAKHLFHFHWNPRPVNTWSDHLKDDEKTKASLQSKLFMSGIYIGNKGRACMSTAHTPADIQDLLDALDSAVGAIMKESNAG